MASAENMAQDMAYNLEADAVKLLESKLPPYVVNCVKGFDNVDPICSMDVSEHKNSICEVESYVEQY